MSSRTEQTRQAIIDAAARLWLERGLHAAGLEEIAAAAGVTRRTIYLHFGGKLALLFAVVDQAEREAGLVFHAGRTPTIRIVLSNCSPARRVSLFSVKDFTIWHLHSDSTGS